MPNFMALGSCSARTAPRRDRFPNALGRRPPVFTKNLQALTHSMNSGVRAGKKPCRHPIIVVPAKAGTQGKSLKVLEDCGFRLRGNAERDPREADADP